MALVVSKAQADTNAKQQAAENKALGREINNGYEAGNGPVKHNGEAPSTSYTNQIKQAQANISPTVAATTTTPTITTPSNSDMITSQYDQSLAAKVAALQKARDSATAGYNQQVDALPGQYQPLRNQADLTGAQNSRGITEQMASQGNWRSGANQTAQTANNASTANNISSLNLQQQQSVDKLKQAIAQVAAGYGSDVATATADTESQKLAALIAQANADKGYSYQEAGLMGTLNGQSTLAAQQLASQNKYTEAGLLGTLNGQQTVAARQADASIANTNANTIYQNLVNNGYPIEQAAKLAQAQATLTGTNLANNNQATTNQYQGQVIQSGLNQQAASTAGTIASTEYQRLVSANYPAEQAAKMAQAAATLTGTNLQNDYQSLTNAGYPAQQAMQLATAQANIDQGNRQLDIAQQQANTSAASAARSSSGSSSANLSAIKYQNDQNSQQSLASSMQGLQNMANNGSSRSDILKFVNSNASDLQANGVPVQDLYKWASSNFTWDKDSSGSWYNTAGN